MPTSYEMLHFMIANNGVAMALALAYSFVRISNVRVVEYYQRLHFRQVYGSSVERMLIDSPLNREEICRLLLSGRKGRVKAIRYVVSADGVPAAAAAMFVDRVYLQRANGVYGRRETAPHLAGPSGTGSVNARNAVLFHASHTVDRENR